MIEKLTQEISTLPEEYCLAIVNYIEALKKNGNVNIPETMMMSEQSLKKEWDTPEEDEAWAHL